MDLTFCAAFVRRDGYGNAAMSLAKRLRERGIKLCNLAAGDQYPRGDAQWNVSGRVLTLSIPPFWGRIECDQLVGFTMYESTRIPDEFASAIDATAERVVVPNAFCQQVFREQVSVPVDVVPLGVDTDEYRPVDRHPHMGMYTFLWSGTPDARKGWDVAYRAFYSAFGHRPDVRLVMHFRKLPHGIRGCTDPNVEVVEGTISQARWLELLAEADCFLYPARGEGWGLVPREAALTGLPVLVTEWGGLADETARWAIPIPAIGMVTATFGRWDPGTIGEWAEPDVDALVHRLRWCVVHRDEAARHGQRAARWLAENRNWDRSADLLCAWLKENRWYA
jgi:glycosyltransferase involved in cell wall biosynthesis